jgi:hypothetical protein
MAYHLEEKINDRVSFLAGILLAEMQRNMLRGKKNV